MSTPASPAAQEVSRFYLTAKRFSASLKKVSRLAFLQMIFFFSTSTINTAKP
jgi:hypothetical protein